MAETRISFIGGGNMASALVGGILRRQPDSEIRVADPDPAQRQRLAADFGVATHESGNEVMGGADMVVLAVKPQVLPEVLKVVGPLAGPECLLLSVAAGSTCAGIEAHCPAKQPVVRAMPNTPALVGAGMTGLYANPHVRAEQRQLAEETLSSVGQVRWIAQESLMDAVTAVSGSGPAYYFLLTEALAAAGQAQGLPEDVADQLARQTALGAALLMADDDTPVDELRRRVTSPGGTTAAALQAFEQGGLRELVDKAVQAATNRGRELAGPGEGQD